jgi:hypothetical protein
MSAFWKHAALYGEFGAAPERDGRERDDNPIDLRARAPLSRGMLLSRPL